MTVEIPSVLAFDRKLENSDALMFSGLWKDKGKPQWKEIAITDRRNRAVKGHKMSDAILNSPDGLQKEVEEANLAWGDDATLPHDCDTLKVSFTLRVLGNPHLPSACNKPSYQEKLKTIIEGYDFDELSARYALNIANGRFLWRNRICAEAVEVHVKTQDEKKPLIFDAYQYPLRDLSSSDEHIEKLQKVIKKGLSGEGFAFVTVEAYVKLGAGQRVWPSQEMVMKIPKGEKTRHLFKLNSCAAMHSQKIGNALRTIDTWYTENALEPIAIEPYGSVTHRGQAYRASRNDFYTLSKKWIIDDKALSDEEQHFVIAVLIRGGVFGESDK